MKEHNPYITQLFQNYLEGKHTEQELEVLLDYFNVSGDSDQLKSLIEQQFDEDIPEVDKTELNDMIAEMEVNIRKAINPPTKRKNKIWWYAAAAVLLIFSINMVTLFVLKDRKEDKLLTSQYGDDVLPGSNRATITLSDGSKYELNEDQAGITINEKGINYDNGGLITATDKIATASLHVPRGGIYNITLQDGTKVFLNSGSTLHYPAHFTGSQRKVELDGEGYFEVTKNAQMPFIVKGNQQEIVVLGTKFNASFYKGEQTTTTLVEGKVQLTMENGQKAVLSPGDQAVINNEKIVVQQVYTQDYISWINNQFVFNNSSLEDVFAQLERWYDIRFEYPKELSQKRLYAEISRDTKLSEVLETLQEVTQLKFTISGRRVLVRN